MLLSVLALCFLSEIISFLQYSTMQKPLLCLQQILIIKAPFACKQTKIRLSHATRYKATKHRSLVTNTKQPYTVSVYQNIKKPYVVSHETKHQTTPPWHAAIKQVNLFNPYIYDKQHNINKPAVIIAGLFIDFRHLCFNGCLCDMQHPFKVGFRNKHTVNRRRSPKNKHLSKIIVFTIRQRKIIRPQTTRINVICILHPLYVHNHNKRSYANS